MRADALTGHIWLTGVSGAGKSTAAPMLAGRIGCAHADSDHWIVARTGRTVAAIFAEDGEPAFRAIEAEAVSMLARGQAMVISLGAGALLAPENQACILGSGTLVHLDAEPETLVDRLIADSEARPLLKVADRGGLHARLDQLRRDRQAIYRLARFAVATDRLTPAEVVERMLAGLSAPPVQRVGERRRA